MKPKPLDLEEFKEFAPNEVAKADANMIVRALYKDEREVDTKEEAIEIVSSLIEEIIDEIKQRIKSACEFYLRYKDNPTMFVKEFPEFEKEVKEIGFVWSPLTKKDFLIEGMPDAIKYYNEWLFKIAFRDVLGGEK